MADRSASTPTQPGSRLVRFEPLGQSVEPIAGETLLDCARRAGVPLWSSCGGAGTCMSCMVRIAGCDPPQPSEADRGAFSQSSLAVGWRRACQVWPLQPCTVHVPAKSGATHIVRKTAEQEIAVVPDPAVRTWRIHPEAPGRESPDDASARLLEAINRGGAGRCRGVDPQLARSLPAAAGEASSPLTAAVRFGELINVLAPGRRALGMAVDLGTTAIGAYLVDLRKGRTLARHGITNPQALVGADVVTRLNAAVRDRERLRQLQRLAVSGINELSGSLCEEAGADPADICDVVLAGNSAMQHLLLGVAVDSLARAPYVAAQRGAVDLKARDLGLVAAPGAYLHVFPGIAGFIGGDHVAALLALQARAPGGTTLLLDIGTNTEISLLHGDALLSVSSPSGPALEGGEISWGMQAARGAIERCEIRDGEPSLTVIGDVPPEGICGSGVLDVLAALRASGAINARGRLQSDHPRVRETAQGREFVLVTEQERNAPAIVFTQGDVRAVQLAKAAIRAGIDVLLEAAGIEECALEHVLVAGAFGSYIAIDSAVAIGMLPALPARCFERFGDAVGLGARLALLSCPCRASAAQIARRARHIEMAGTRAFQRRFMRRINLD